MAALKQRLSMPAPVDDFFQDARLVGLVSRRKEYQLCWEINRNFGFQFKMNNDLEVMLVKKEKKCFFSVYEFHEPARFTAHYLYHNHYKGEYLLPELRHFDFIWLIKGAYYQDEGVEWLGDILRKMDGIQLVSVLDATGLKHKEHLIL